MFCISRKDRRERRDLFPFLFHADAGVVANFVTTRVRREFYPPPPPCGVLAPVSGGETDPSPTLPQGEGVVTTDLCPHQQDIILPSLVEGLGEGPLGGGWSRFCFASAIAWFALEVLRPLRPLREIKISM